MYSFYGAEHNSALIQEVLNNSVIQKILLGNVDFTEHFVWEMKTGFTLALFIKNCSTSLITKRMQIKTAPRSLRSIRGMKKTSLGNGGREDRRGGTWHKA